MQMECLIVEDEPLAAEVLADYIGQVPFLSIAGHCTDAVKALDILKKQSIDVIFLDLHLPGLKGFELLATLPHQPQVIITTAYHQYALEGYEWNVVDYLMKPVDFARFLAAVNKLKITNTKDENSIAVTQAPTRQSIFVYSDKMQVRLFLDEILFVESEGDYLKIISRDDSAGSAAKTVIIRQTLQQIEKQLPTSLFLRIHRSFIVNADAIRAFDAGRVEVNGKSIPVGRQFRERLRKRLMQDE